MAAAIGYGYYIRNSLLLNGTLTFKISPIPQIDEGKVEKEKVGFSQPE